MSYGVLWHVLPEPVKIVMLFALAVFLLVLGLLFAPTCVLAAMCGDALQAGEFFLIEAAVVFVAGFCIVCGAVIYSPRWAIGLAGLVVAGAGVVATWMFITVPPAELFPGMGAPPDAPAAATMFLQYLCGPGVVAGGILVFALQWWVIRRRAAARGTEH